jgi:hypothetical protein
MGRQDSGERVDEAGLAGRSGRTTDRGMNCVSSRFSLGRRPARKNDDLPDPEAPRIAINRGGAATLRPRRRSMASTIGASRPKKMPASDASCGFKPRYGGRSGSPSGGQVKNFGSSPAFSSPRFSRDRPSRE